MAGKKSAKFLNIAHPNSRKVRQLERKSRREERINENIEKKQARELLEATRFFWFREQCIALGYTSKSSPPTLEEAQVMTELYINRNNSEISSLKLLRNPLLGRINKMESIKTIEMDAFNSSKGIVIPDITDKDNLEILTEIWDGHSDTCHLVPRLNITKNGKLNSEILNKIKEKLEDINKIREKAIKVTPNKARKFQEQGLRVQSVKKIAKVEDIKNRSRIKGVERQQKRLKEGRKAILNSKRND